MNVFEFLWDRLLSRRRKAPDKPKPVPRVERWVVKVAPSVRAGKLAKRSLHVVRRAHPYR